MRSAAVSFSIIVATAGLALAPARRSAAADAPQAPQIPTAKLSQQVGLTEISVEYDRPAVLGRRIWGGVVPYDRPWLIGGNAGTKIKFSKTVRVGDQVVPSGSYWLLATPGKSGWTLMLNKDAAGALPYKPDLDIVRVRAVPRTVVRSERLLFTFSDVSEDHASLDLEWDNLRVSLPIQVSTTAQLLTSISGLDMTWRAFTNAARYMLETARDYDSGLKYIDQALALKDDWYSMWVKGALLAAKGDFRQAHEWAVKARELAQQAGNGAALAPELDKAIAEWTRKGGGARNEAQALRKLGDESPANAGRAPEAAPPPPPTPVIRTAEEEAPPPVPTTPFRPVRETPAPPTPAAKATAEKEPVRPPAGDPPLLHRARLRRR